jgi:hypothetical protein
MADTILLVFEGAKTEPSIFDQVKTAFFHNKRYARYAKRMVYAVFGTNILTLWKKLKEVGHFDTVEMVREIAKNKDDLKKYAERMFRRYTYFLILKGIFLKNRWMNIVVLYAICSISLKKKPIRENYGLVIRWSRH